MYQSPFSPNEIKYFMDLMQNDTTKGKGSTYAKLEVLLSSTKNAYEINWNKLFQIEGQEHLDVNIKNLDVEQDINW